MTASPPPVLPDERLAAGIARLAVRYHGHFSPETIQRLIIDSYERLAEHARIRTHLVVLAEHLATERLDALAHVQGAPGSGLPRVLFVCSHNAGRSQMAAALLAHRVNGSMFVSSAGTHPAAAVEQVVAQVLTEAGVDLTDAFPKPLTDEVVQAADIVITMGCGDACPIVPGRRYLDWPVTDPEGAPIAVVRSIRDEIDAHITQLLDSLPST
ncbi:arsenate reductase ArsC [Streptomyces sp. 5-6(2022)]|uniref:arsenate-mycothiol transferase ArsC n=1 Tax=Streptomyces sp. 5-6(2022) TaxID=2936510 RepID=UPI0023B8E9B0|nr:arsenate reductase ArsC [Streptomyces sp. 5-6(2022)]